MKKHLGLFALVAAVALVFIYVGCSREQSNPVSVARMTAGSSPECIVPPEGVVTSLQVSKTAEGHWNRYLNWTMSKTADPTSAEVCVGDPQEINYTVTVTQEGFTEKYLVSGTITIVNDQGEEGEDKTAYIGYVDDAIEARVGREWVAVQRVTIKQEFTIPTGGTMVIPYEVEFVPPAGYKSLRNVAYVLLKNHAPKPGREKVFLYRESFTLPESPTLVNECVDVYDSWKGYLGKVCGEGASKTFAYSRTVSYDVAGTYSVENTATANGQSASAVVTVLVKNCGCQEETAWGGDFEGGGKAWWYYFDTQGPAVQSIYAGKEKTDGTVFWDGTNLTINLGSWSLQNVDEPVKVQGYNTIPDTRPEAGLFTTYKGSDLKVTGDGSRYYAIHLDVELCP